MAIPDEQIEQVMHVLTKWNPLGEMASTIHDLDGYRTEAIDILFSLGMPGAPDNLAQIIQSVLNQAFNLELSIDDCLTPAAEIERIVK
jgi:hypothetical protein